MRVFFFSPPLLDFLRHEIEMTTTTTSLTGDVAINCAFLTAPVFFIGSGFIYTVIGDLPILELDRREIDAILLGKGRKRRRVARVSALTVIKAFRGEPAAGPCADVYFSRGPTHQKLALSLEGTRVCTQAGFSAFVYLSPWRIRRGIRSS